MNKHGLKLSGMVASSRVNEFTKKDNSKGYSQVVAISDGENTYIYSNFLLGPELAQTLNFGQEVVVEVDYVAMEGRNIKVGGELTTIEQANKKSA